MKPSGTFGRHDRARRLLTVRHRVLTLGLLELPFFAVLADSDAGSVVSMIIMAAINHYKFDQIADFLEDLISIRGPHL